MLARSVARFVLLLGLAGCSALGSESDGVSVSPQVLSWPEGDSTTLTVDVQVSVCEPEGSSQPPLITAVHLEETADEIRLSIDSEIPEADVCTDQGYARELAVELQQPVGDRLVVDPRCREAGGTNCEQRRPED